MKRLEAPNLDRLFDTLNNFETDLLSRKAQMPDIVNVVSILKTSEAKADIPRIELPKIVKRDAKTSEESIHGLANESARQMTIETTEVQIPTVNLKQTEIEAVVITAPEKKPDFSNTETREDIRIPKASIEVKEKPSPIISKKPLLPKPKQLPALSKTNLFDGEIARDEKLNTEEMHKDQSTDQNTLPEKQKSANNSDKQTLSDAPQEFSEIAIPPPPLSNNPQRLEAESIKAANLEQIQPPPKTDISKLIAPPPKSKLLMNKSKVPVVKPMAINPSIPPTPEVNELQAEPERPVVKQVARPPSPPEPLTVDPAEDPSQAFFNQLAQSQNIDDQNQTNDEALNQESTKTILSSSIFVFDETVKKRASLPGNSQGAKQQMIDNDTKSEQNFKDNESVEDNMSMKSLQMNDLHEYSGKAIKNPFAAKKETKEGNIFKKKTINSLSITTGIPDNLF